MDRLQTDGDLPLEFPPLAVVRRPDEFSGEMPEVQSADALLFYAGGDGGGDLMANVNFLDSLGKDVIFFVRHKSGPLYYWYEGVMAGFRHQHTDALATPSIGYDDVVVHRLDEVLRRLRSLCGLHNTLGSRVVAVGGAGGGVQPAEIISELVRNRWKLDIQTVSYDDLGKLLEAARIMTHFESDYGAAPKVEMPVGQTLANIVPDFKAERWTGVSATIEEAPFLPICRSQIDVRYACRDDVLTRHMPGFHGITGYGDYLKEVGCAVRKVGIAWDDISDDTARTRV